MNGIVNSALEATVTITVIGPSRRMEITAIIDTGYNGSLSLPVSVVKALGLPLLISRPVRLGDDSLKLLSFYEATTIWDEEPYDVQALCVDGDPLIGTELIRAFRMAADFVPGGDVEIAPIR